MSSTLVLIALLASLSMAVILPEVQISKKNNSINYSFTPEYDYMVNKQRKVYLVIGLVALATFFVSLQTMSVGLFIVHLITDCIFGIYAFISFQVRRSTQLQNSLNTISENNYVEYDNEEYLKEAV
jgi:Ca2+/Na+ antiporter|tara:strand:- start:415 stop:792 length:378 start_codon:yes stop_codon:yes gene_type:complete